MQRGEVLMGWMIGWLFDVEFFRLKEELEILRKMFKEHMRVSEEHLEMTYKKKAKDHFYTKCFIIFMFRFLILKHPWKKLTLSSLLTM